MIYFAIIVLLSLGVGYFLLSTNAASDTNETYIIKINDAGKRYVSAEKRELNAVEKRTRFLYISWTLIPAILFLLLYILGVR